MGDGEYCRGSIRSSCEPSVRVWAAPSEVLPSSVDAAVSLSAIVEADSVLVALFLGGCTASDARPIEGAVEKASASGKPMARSAKAAAATSTCRAGFVGPSLRWKIRDIFTLAGGECKPGI